MKFIVEFDNDFHGEFMTATMSFDVPNKEVLENMLAKATQNFLANKTDSFVVDGYKPLRLGQHDPDMSYRIMTLDEFFNQHNHTI